MDTNTVLLAFGLTLFAGLATGIGSAMAFFAKTTNTKFLSVALGFSAGVMIYVSMIEIFVKARESLVEVMGNVAGSWITVGGFFGGIFLIAIIDRLVPSMENPHEIHLVEEIPEQEEKTKKIKLKRIGFFTALVIALHNFPEGMATFMATLQDPSLGLAIAVAIAIHNIPEGIAVSVPVYYGTDSRKKAFFLSFASGLAEPVGALMAYFLFIRFFSDLMFGISFAFIAGIMVFISLDELLPAAREFGEHHLSIYGMVAGMVIMAVSLLLFL